MISKAKIVSISFSLFTFSSVYSQQKEKIQNNNSEKTVVVKEKTTFIIKNDSLKIKSDKDVKVIDSLKTVENNNIKFYKKNVHASYYADRFEGRKTASGSKFSNNHYTAAHKKLPFGTKVKVTNNTNNKFVFVEITDRGPFAKTREIDLSKKAFMDICTNKNEGVLTVTIEIIED